MAETQFNDLAGMFVARNAGMPMCFVFCSKARSN